MRKLLMLLAACSAFPAYAASAQSAPQPGPAPTPCVSSPERHQFDFWIGEWTVHPAQKLDFTAGTSRVESIAGGCGLLENWTAFNGGSGKSINAYNPATKQWEQYWVGQGGQITHYAESKWDGKTLVYLARGGVPWQRLSFTPMEDGTVRQFGEISTDSGKTWKVGYDFRYRRK
jgi:hypothetical protein